MIYFTLFTFFIGYEVAFVENKEGNTKNAKI